MLHVILTSVPHCFLPLRFRFTKYLYVQSNSLAVVSKNAKNIKDLRERMDHNLKFSSSVHVGMCLHLAKLSSFRFICILIKQIHLIEIEWFVYVVAGWRFCFVSHHFLVGSRGSGCYTRYSFIYSKSNASINTFCELGSISYARES